jgi:hypothetical protein
LNAHDCVLVLVCIEISDGLNMMKQDELCE